MAELSVGQRCQERSCGRLDFLPFICDGCSGIFCLEHRSKDAHVCSGICIKKEPIKLEGPSSYSCTYKNCNAKEPLPVICPYCEKHFCLGHRHQSDHDCEKLEVPKPRLAVTKQPVKETVESRKAVPVKKGRGGAKNSETAAKVALMKLKLHAVGEKSIPQNERVYFQVFLPRGSNEKSRAVFFCSKWNIGKVVDSAAALMNVRNDNNISTAKKLRLYHSESGSLLPMDNTLESYLKNTDSALYNGGNIILEYMDNNNTVLENTNSYME
ncbi:AN1-type zinc finger protein 1 [Callorhinchus milii]|uniref:AN1-type zinc finger protein 1-like protein n=1 Tax=Callorhinchus milii TaxID=7868 RepID=V9LAD6_CALMI|nr:AN1-type zinc finger protein 1 [Callorhinchus milii]|eukprot:gi/632958307/ref/XP_007894962.1/ PREDICTED: AN1-type zinc finger protein 1 [Callorhinchus milii]